MHLLLVVNPSASSVTGRRTAAVAAALRADHDVTVVETRRRNHATRLAADGVAAGAEVVVALGGDGTLNEAANGLVGTDAALAVLPGGSTNVFARTIGLPGDPVEAAHQLVAALAAGSRRRIGVGTVNGRRFLFHVGVGFDAAVVEQVERRASIKRFASHPLFVASAFSTWFLHYDRLRPRFEVDGQPGSFTIVLNSSPYTYLGSRPLDVLPEATLDAPLCALHFRSTGMFDLLRTVAAALIAGDVRSVPSIDVRTDLDALEIRSDRPFPFQVDGDHLGEASVLAFRHQPDALDVIVPVGRS